MDGPVVAEGWYVDPYGVHQDRWFSAGVPSRLVRDDGVESEDPPPAGPCDGPLERATSTEGQVAHGDDLRRAGDRQGEPYDPLQAFDAVLDGTTWFPLH